MKILHTSDWHLGQNFMNKSREDEHRNFLKWLLVQLKEQAIDTLVVAGDIFDTGTPPSYARSIYFDFLKEVKETGCRQVVIVGGNHDSVATLNESSGLLNLLGVIVVGGAKEKLEEEVVVLNKRTGEPGAVICAVPYLRDRDVRQSNAGETTADKNEALRKGISNHYGKVYDLGLELSEKHGKLPIIATGHLTTSGSELSEGVRELYIGSLNGYATGDFPSGFDYIALGHLHKKQVMGDKKQIRYCGSPIPLSFMEARFDRSVNIVMLKRNDVPEVEELVVPCFQKMKTISGNIDQVGEKIKGLDISSLDDDETIWVEIEVEDNGIQVDLTATLDEMTKDIPIEILRTKKIRKTKSDQKIIIPSKKLSELTPEEVFNKRLQSEGFTAEKQQQLTNLFKQIYTQVQEKQP